MSTASGPLVLIEPYAYRLDGHHLRTLVALARARPGALVIAPNGIAREAASGLREARARLVTAAAGPGGGLLLRAAGVLARLSWAGQRIVRHRRWPRQLTMLARCLVEAAALRTARRLAPDAQTVVILSANEALHGAAAVLGGTPHLRFVHQAGAEDGQLVRVLERLARRAERRVVALCPTEAVREQTASRFPGVAAQVRVAMVDDSRPLTEGEREGGRLAFSLPPAAAVVCLVGGWWPHKDITLIDQALALVTEPLHVIVTGHPLDEQILARWQTLPKTTVHIEPGPLSEPVLRLIYAAADATLVARHPGTAVVPGGVMDAARYGVPLILSGHDPHLTARLKSEPWVRLFTAGDPHALAAALEDLAHRPLPLPGQQAPRQMDMPTAEEQAAFLTRAAAPFATEGSGC